MDYTSLYFIALVFLALILYFIPIFPAWYEWKYKTDAQPFAVNFQDKTLVDYDIRLFKEYIVTHFSSILENYSDEFNSSKDFSKVGKYYITGQVKLLNLEEGQSSTNNVVLFKHNGELPKDVQFKNKVYSCEDLKTGANNTFTQIYSEQNLLLTENNKVKKLIYSGNTLTVGAQGQLQGFAKAKTKIHFLGPAQFQYLHATIIAFSTEEPPPTIKAMDIMGANIPRLVTEEHFSIPDHKELTRNLVVKGTLKIGKNCKILGNIKCYENIKIGDNTIIMGAIFCTKNIDIGDNCYIQGPIVSYASLSIGKNCFIGSADALTSIIGLYIHIAQGCYVKGQVLAKIKGIHTIIT